MRMRNDTRLKQLLNKYNVTQQSFADILCVTRYTAWKIINNKRPLRSDEIVRICEKFNVSANWLLGLNEEIVLEKDGTLIVTTEHYFDVSRVLVQDGIYGTLFYQD